MRLGHAPLRASLFLLRAGRWGRLRHLVVESLAADSLTWLVAIVVGASRPLLRHGVGMAQT